MKRILLAAAMTAMISLLAACGAQKNDLDTGWAMVKQGDCAGAQPYLESTIAQPDSAMDLAYAYFLKARCAEDASDYAAAYENYYAAKVVACYVVSHDTHVNLNTYARSDYCQRIIPAKLEALSAKINDPAGVEHIEGKVNGILRADYLKRFDKRLN
ncbi:hypothetical protein DND132_0018 [Pseudodesulfovibrio mercurii]|uniref:Lipoprotein n=1 Tax=Pseudodesulfovibrio mercurii TaxID=641491 RepID=F0JCQ8_9BACT|nr:hypothetical protein [Pseudodesulfovibrio mercurii]EGB13236.1 hypothetical protein DND132_0018 [Pseudodesulfovibrio mercurii]